MKLLLILLSIVILFACTSCKKAEIETSVPVPSVETSEEPSTEPSPEPSAEVSVDPSREPKYYPGIGEIIPDILEETNEEKQIYTDVEHENAPEEIKKTIEHPMIFSPQREEGTVEYCNKIATKQGESISDKTRVYSEEVIYKLGFPTNDLGEYLDHSGSSLFMADILSCVTTNAIRVVNEDEFCLIYDTDTNMRVFIWCTKDYGLYQLYGYPIYMAETLSYSDFADVEIGDRETKVEEIDPKIVEIFLRKSRGVEVEKTQAAIDEGDPPVSRHLLTDGLLVITYGRDEDGFFVSNIEFHEDFTIDTIGGPQCCKIDPLDYVTQG